LLVQVHRANRATACSDSRRRPPAAQVDIRPLIGPGPSSVSHPIIHCPPRLFRLCATPRSTSRAVGVQGGLRGGSAGTLGAQRVVRILKVARTIADLVNAEPGTEPKEAVNVTAIDSTKILNSRSGLREYVWPMEPRMAIDSGSVYFSDTPIAE